MKKRLILLLVIVAILAIALCIGCNMRDKKQPVEPPKATETEQVIKPEIGDIKYLLDDILVFGQTIDVWDEESLKTVATMYANDPTHPYGEIYIYEYERGIEVDQGLYSVTVWRDNDTMLYDINLNPYRHEGEDGSGAQFMEFAGSLNKVTFLTYYACFDQGNTMVDNTFLPFPDAFPAYRAFWCNPNDDEETDILILVDEKLGAPRRQVIIPEKTSDVPNFYLFGESLMGKSVQEIYDSYHGDYESSEYGIIYGLNGVTDLTVEYINHGGNHPQLCICLFSAEGTAVLNIEENADGILYDYSNTTGKTDVLSVDGNQEEVKVTIPR